MQKRKIQELKKKTIDLSIPINEARTSQRERRMKKWKVGEKEVKEKKGVKDWTREGNIDKARA